MKNQSSITGLQDPLIQKGIKKVFSKRIFIIISVLLCISISSTSAAQQKEIDSLLHVLRQHTSRDSVRASLLLRLSYLYQGKNLKNAEKCAVEALNIAEDLHNNDFLMFALFRVGSVYTWQQKTTAALNIYYRQLSLAELDNNLNRLQSAYLGIAYIYEAENDWEKALSYTLKAVPIVEQTGKPGDIAYAYRFLSKEYLMTGNGLKAEWYIHKAISKYNPSSDYDPLGDCMLNLADILVSRKQYVTAKWYYDSSLYYFNKAEEPSQAAEVYQNLGKMYITLSDFKNAEICCKKTIELLNKDFVAASDYATAYLGLGIVALNEKKFDSASIIFHREFAQLQKDSIIDLQLSYLLYMAAADSAMGNYKEAMQHLQQYKNLYSNYYNDVQVRATQRMLAEFDMQKKEKENQQLKEQNEMQRERMVIFFISGIIMLIAAIFLALLYRQKTAALKSLKELQHSTEEKNKELDVLNSVKNKLISMIAHDIRSPLTSLLSILHITREKIIDLNEFNQLSKMLEDEVRHLLTMLDNTMHWARDQIQSIDIEKTNFNLHDLAREVIELYHQSAEKKSLHIVNSISPETEVFSDREIVHTVLRNLLSNAIKFTPAGKNILLTQQQKNGSLLITIQDEGVGISKEIMDKIASKEFISTRGTHNEKGTGLGLLFSLDLLARLNEKISIDTSASGTAVTFTINNAE